MGDSWRPQRSEPKSTRRRLSGTQARSLGARMRAIIEFRTYPSVVIVTIVYLHANARGVILLRRCSDWLTCADLNRRCVDVYVRKRRCCTLLFLSLASQLGVYALLTTVCQTIWRLFTMHLCFTTAASTNTRSVSMFSLFPIAFDSLNPARRSW